VSFFKKLFGTTESPKPIMKYDTEYQPAIFLRMSEILLDGLKENLATEEKTIKPILTSLFTGRSLPDIEGDLIDQGLSREDICELMLRAKAAKTYGDDTSKKVCGGDLRALAEFQERRAKK
jgi:hypothetical protein